MPSQGRMRWLFRFICAALFSSNHAIPSQPRSAMKRFIHVRYFFAFVVLLAVSLTFAQSIGKVSLQLVDGSVVKGRVLSQTDDEVTIDSTIGMVTVKMTQISDPSLKQLAPTQTDELSALRMRVTQLEKIVAALQEENQELRA